MTLTDNQIRLLAFDSLNRLTAVRLHADPQPVTFKVLTGQIRQSFIVFDDENTPTFVCLFHAIYL